MMMKPWMARALRRFLGTSVMLIGGQSVIHGLLYPGPEMPPAGTDLVRVLRGDGIHEITDPATVEGMTAFVRGLRGPAIRVAGDRMDAFNTPTACFHRTAGHPADEVLVCLQYAPDAMLLSARRDALVYRISREAGARFQRLVEYGIAVSAP
jgi:hypothetical protein